MSGPPQAKTGDAFAAAFWVAVMVYVVGALIGAVAWIVDVLS